MQKIIFCAFIHRDRPTVPKLLVKHTTLFAASIGPHWGKSAHSQRKATKAKIKTVKLNKKKVHEDECRREMKEEGF